MAWNETKLTVVGTVCTDVVVRSTTDGSPMALFSIASNERKFNRETELWENGNSLFVKLRCFKRLADEVGATFQIGDRVVATGRVHTNKYVTADGQHRQELVMDAVAVGPDLSFCSARIERSRQVEAVAA
jgi:single-strand DNA-binding protein